MNFAFNEDQSSLGETVAKVLADIPVLRSPDLERSHGDAAWNALADLGLFALLVPERFDGVGLGMVDVALAVEALGAGLAPPLIASTLAATDLLVRHGSEGQQRALLPAIAAGTHKIAIAIVDDGGDYLPSADGASVVGGRLKGEKLLVAGAGEADTILALAIDGGRPTLLLIPRRAAGVQVRPHDDIDPATGLGAIRFDCVAVKDDLVVGRVDTDRAMARLIDVGATLQAGMLIGITATMLDRAVSYAKTRVQFGQPIGAFQAIKHRCADMAIAVEAGRSAAYYAFWAVDEDAPDRTRAASMAKAYCGEVARQVCNDTIQVHGGMGFTWELGLHRYLRRAKVLEHAFGDTRFHNERVLAETLAGAQNSTDRQLDAA